MARRCVVALVAVAALLQFVSSTSDAELLALRSENAELKAEVARLNLLLPKPKVIEREAYKNVTAVLKKIEATEFKKEGVQLMAILLGMAFLWAIPLTWPFKQCCMTRLHKVYPFIFILELAAFSFAMNYLYMISANQIFFMLVKVLEVIIGTTQLVCVGLAGLLGLAVVWKFKDRILEALGIDNAAHYLGEPRDWMTCWSMKRFKALELLVWKVEGLPSVKIHSKNDCFIEVRQGYNVSMRTRVHENAGHTCVFKETMQLNFDPFDGEAMITILVRNQDVFGATDMAQLQLGAAQVKRLEEPLGGNTSERLISRAEGIWQSDRFKCIDLIPAGKIWLRFSYVDASDDSGGFFGCCCPFGSSAEPRGNPAASARNALVEGGV